jgi:hypothetical protein
VLPSRLREQILLPHAKAMAAPEYSYESDEGRGASEPSEVELLTEFCQARGELWAYDEQRKQTLAPLLERQAEADQTIERSMEGHVGRGLVGLVAGERVAVELRARTDYHPVTEERIAAACARATPARLREAERECGDLHEALRRLLVAVVREECTRRSTSLEIRPARETDAPAPAHVVRALEDRQKALESLRLARKIDTARRKPAIARQRQAEAVLLSTMATGDKPVNVVLRRNGQSSPHQVCVRETTTRPSVSLKAFEEQVCEAILARVPTELPRADDGTEQALVPILNGLGTIAAGEVKAWRDQHSRKGSSVTLRRKRGTGEQALSARKQREAEDARVRDLLESMGDASLDELLREMTGQAPPPPGQ